MKKLFFVLMLLLVLSCGCTNQDDCSNNIQDNKSNIENSNSSSVSSDISLSNENYEPEVANIFYWTTDKSEDKELLRLQKELNINDENEIRSLATLLIKKGTYLCSLAEGENTKTGEFLGNNSNNSETIKDDNGNQYCLINKLPYNSTSEIWDDIYDTFTNSVASEQFAFMFRNLYVDINDSLYYNINVGPAGKQRFWHLETMTVESISSQSIVLEMSVERHDVTISKLEMVFENGKWLLNNSYFS